MAQSFPCDVCKSNESVEVPHCREYTNGQAVDICVKCGFVFVKNRRSADEIAATWSKELFGANYTALIPAVVARQTYVAATIDKEIGLKGKTLCDIGAGEGQFLEIARKSYQAQVFGVEPSTANCQRLQQLDIPFHEGTIESFASKQKSNSFDAVSVMWTLENCLSCVDMLKAAHAVLNEGGHVAVATGSRLMVPFKKPLYDYLSKNPADTHSFRFSPNSLQNVVNLAGFEVTFVNRYLDSDVLLCIGKKTKTATEPKLKVDKYLDVYNYFERWHVETQMYFPQAR